MSYQLLMQFQSSPVSLLELAGPNGPTPEKKSGAPRSTTSTNPATSLRKQADSLTAKIEHLKNPPIGNQRPTPRRARIAEGMFQEGERLERLQKILRALADAHDSGTCPVLLQKIRRRAEIEDMLRRPAEDPTRAAMLNLCPESTSRRIDAEIRKRERELIGQAIPGYYPTPPQVIARMLELVGDEPGLFLLEPSAGRGDIAEALRKKYPGALIDVLEYNGQLQQLLQLKGFHWVGADFLQHHAAADCIVMNPPFEDSQDIHHIRHAYDCLNPGGILVAVVSEGPFFRKDKTAAAFRDWLESVGAHVEANPPGAFLKSDRPTGVNTRLIRILK